MSRNSSIIGSIIGLMFFLGFGIFFLVGSRMFYVFPILPLFPMIFVIMVIGIIAAASASSRRSALNCCPPRFQNQYRAYPREVPKSNPYVVNTSSSPTVRPIHIEEEEPEKPISKFCQYCGAKRDINAIYCHNCGTLLQ
jgi:hypothetical protein